MWLRAKNLLSQLETLHTDNLSKHADDAIHHTFLLRSPGSKQPSPPLDTSRPAMRPARGATSRSRTPVGAKASLPSTPTTCCPSSRASSLGVPCGRSPGRPVSPGAARHRTRTPTAAGSHSARPAPKAARRTRLVPAADALVEALRQVVTKGEANLEDLAKELLTAADSRRLAMEESSESEEDNGPRVPRGRVRRLEQTVESRLRQALRLYALSQNAKDTAENLSYLEEVSVGPQTSVAYKQEARAFFEWATKHGLSLVVADEIDNALVAYMNSLFFQGHQAWRGQKLLASIAFLDSSLGRNGARKIPRSWRALKGWMLKTPPRSRLPQPWMLWCGIMADLSHRGFRAMAIMLLLMVTCYLRPSDAMRMRHGDVIPPAHGVEDST